MIKLLPLTAALLLATAGSIQAQIRLDGSFTDWNSNAATYQEAAEELSTPDLSAFSITNDESYLYLYLEADREYKLHDKAYPINPAEVEIYLDTDHNAATGYVIEDLGAELVIRAGNRNAVYYGAGDPISINLHRLDLVSLPTVTSSRYEIAISLKGIDKGAIPLFESSSIRLLVKELTSGDILPDAGGFTYTLREDLQQSYSPVLIRQAELEEPQLRIMTHNTEHDGLADASRKEQFARLYQAVAPDILTLNENWGTPASVVKSFMDQYLPLGTEHGWYVSKLVYGNITLSRYPIIQSWEVSPGDRLAASFIDLPDELFGRDVLIINGHLQCCEKDDRRQQQADPTIRFILDAQTEGNRIDLPLNTPIIFSGDMNLVGDSRQLNTIVNGSIQDVTTYGEGRLPDWNGTPLQDIHPLQTDHPFAYTWRNPSGSFPPSRIDYIFYTGSVLDVQKGFVLNTSIMPQEKLDALGLLKGDTEASDHFPVVADFTMQGCLEAPQEVLFSGLPDSFMEVDAPVTLEGQPANGQFWGPGVNGNTFSPEDAGPGLHLIKYTVWNENGCSSSYQQQVRVVSCDSEAIPVSFSGLADTVLVADTLLALRGEPANGVFSGPGITENSFDPTLAGAGDHTITYTVQAQNGCSYSYQQQVKVVDCNSGAISVSFSGLADTVMIADTLINLSGRPVKGTFSGPGMSGNLFDPSLVGPGEYTIAYTVQAENGCSYSYSQQVTVVPASPTGIQDTFLEQLVIMPNPASTNFIIKLPEPSSQTVWLNIFSPDGRRLTQQQLQQQQTEVSLRDMPSGLLFIQVRTAKGQKTYRLLKTAN